MEPLTILLWTAVWAGVAAGIYATAYFLDLTFQILDKWFKKFAYLMVAYDRRSFQNREYVAFTVQKAMASGDYNIVQGIFDNRNQKIYDATAYIPESNYSTIDAAIKQAHNYGRKEVVLWE